ncbi:hypothetical protein AAFF_G00297110 [Aldrovandia affinis]|uniref:Uncharacterized protein n=1 Tax=Aldrovandia affinis TaxID=143900 RepID=A0AAD7SQK0_9TELE|nr:hypothetical protein AAFF_G00297110 [Aldrovandia affinis]
MVIHCPQRSRLPKGATGQSWEMRQGCPSAPVAKRPRLIMIKTRGSGLCAVHPHAGGEAINLKKDQWGVGLSTCGENEEPWKGLATAQISASTFCAGQPWRAGGSNIVEQISTNLSLLVCGSGGALLASLRDQPALPFTLPTCGVTEEGTGGDRGPTGDLRRVIQVRLISPPVRHTQTPPRAGRRRPCQPPAIAAPEQLRADRRPASKIVCLFIRAADAHAALSASSSQIPV